jgi:histidyl-tRNA synthetase
VRGLDYYTGLVFEATSDELGAQDAYLGGGRYDNLSEQLDGKDLPCIGMAIGIERLALLSNLVIEAKTLISFIILSSNFKEKAYKIAHDLRTINPEIIIDVQLTEGSLKSKLRKASKNNAKFAIIIGEEEIETNTIIIKPLIEKNSEQTVMDINEISSFFEDIT